MTNDLIEAYSFIDYFPQYWQYSKTKDNPHYHLSRDMLYVSQNKPSRFPSHQEIVLEGLTQTSLINSFANRMERVVFPVMDKTTSWMVVVVPSLRNTDKLEPIKLMAQSIIKKSNSEISLYEQTTLKLANSKIDQNSDIYQIYSSLQVENPRKGANVLLITSVLSTKMVRAVNAALREHDMNVGFVFSFAHSIQKKKKKPENLLQGSLQIIGKDFWINAV